MEERKEAPKRIMIVEDEKIVALDIKNHLLRFGYEVLGMFSYAEKSLEALEDELPDLILMDVKLKGQMDGIEAARIIRENYRIPVIILTAFADDKTIARAKNTGSSGYIIKPFEAREFRITIELALYRSRMERKLYEREQLFLATLNSITDPLVVVDNQRKIQHMNIAAEKISASKLTLLHNQVFDDLFRLEKNDDSLYYNLYTPGYKEGMESLTVEVKTSDFIDGDGKINGKVYTLHDVTPRQNLENQLRHSQKMEAIGRLAGGVAHDFNNVLTIIMGFCNLILDTEEDAESIKEDVIGIQKASKGAATLTRQLLVFSRNQVLHTQVVNIITLIKDLEKMLLRLITEDVRLTLIFEEESLYAMVDPGQIEQVVINLVVNSRDAMLHGGHLVIRVKHENLRSEKIIGTSSIPSGDYILLEVEDSGSGIPDEVLSKIFEPFFTTKEKTKGTGLGLSTVYGIIQQSKGYIDVVTKLNEGTTFKIYLPEVFEETFEKKDDELTEKILVNLENITVLLVEDENFLRKLVFRMLTSRGCKVLEAKNSGEAILLAQNYKESIDLIVSDIVMPHLSGFELFDRIKKIIPKIVPLFMSGYPENVIQEKYQPQENWPLIKKPFDVTSFINKVEEVLRD